MHIYFARSIRGDRRREDAEIYGFIDQQIKICGVQTQFGLKVDEALRDLDIDTFIYRRDIGWIDQCDAMIAIVNGPSHGVGYEIAYAQHVRKIPVLCVHEKDNNLSAMIKGSQHVVEYRDRSHLAAIIQGFLEGLQEGVADADQKQS